MKQHIVFRKKMDLAIINRSFWPKSQVLGEALLQYAELSSQERSVCIITQEENLERQLKEKNRGLGLKVYGAKSYTTSSSSLPSRSLESIYFMAWTIKSLIQARPKTIYVSTNPPVVVPFIVALYSQITRSDYIYHLQDIHPEAANIVVPLNKTIFNVLKMMDNYTIQHAKSVITLSEEMKNYVEKRSKANTSIYLLDNPSFNIIPIPTNDRKKDIIFCGNAGRFQRIPLLINAIEKYLSNEGKMNFTFAGNGIYASAIQALSDKFDRVDYLGFVPGEVAAEQIRNHKWSLLPIDDEVTRFAFPSKSSGYALSGSGILAICGLNTSVSRWIHRNKIGIVCEPNLESLVQCFFDIENSNKNSFNIDSNMRDKLQISYFSKKLKGLTFNRNK